MAKKAALYSDAERLFVQDQLTLEAISEKLGVSTRTLTTWKVEGEWEDKRAKFLEISTSNHELLQELVNLLLKKQVGKVRDGEDPDRTAIYLITKAVPSLSRLKEYEDSSSVKKDKKGLTAEAIRQIEQEILGF